MPDVAMQRCNKFFLFGYPIAHSTSPAFHTSIFQSLSLPNSFELFPTATITQDVLVAIRSPSFGGAAVTMPLKVEMMKHVDVISPEAQEIGSINTIVVQGVGDDGVPILLGTNTDCIGIRNALLGHDLGSNPRLEQQLTNKWAFIIGGGGTTRAAIYALSQLGIDKIFLINRDPEETRAIIKSFPGYNLSALNSVDDWQAEHESNVACGVGAIPSIPPITEGEKNVYAIARRVFASVNPSGSSRRFLEMAYKPRRTTMFEIAESSGWQAIGGTEAMVEQGLAQSRLWLLHSDASPYPRHSRSELGDEVELVARDKVRYMSDL
ncbi:hypothetical protein OIO90_006248 [Microbotryomycetes sp. JL221]|nr:hypothetical protein OIO90_006248 [Microbotryomycetes sp. JL221]